MADQYKIRSYAVDKKITPETLMVFKTLRVYQINCISPEI